jgi:hypothetical protein
MGGVRVRISTALLACGLLGYPWAVYWLPVPHPFLPGSNAEWLLNWVLYNFSGLLIAVAFLAASITFIVFAARKRWRSLPQHVLEMVIAFVCFVSLPAY